MDREYTVQVGDAEAHISVLQIGARSWVARATRVDGEPVESLGDDPDYALERVKLFLQHTDQTEASN